MRKKMESFEKLGKFKIKIVERTGNKLVDVLHKSNAWSLMDCERSDCLICSTDSSKKGSCRTRNVLYETFCITCKREEEERERQRGGEVDDAMEKEASIGENEVVKVRQENEANDTPVLVEADSIRNIVDAAIEAFEVHDAPEAQKVTVQKDMKIF